MKQRIFGAVAALVLACAAAPVSAVPVYDNGGPNPDGGWGPLSTTYEFANDFTLTAEASLTSATFYNLRFFGDGLTSLTYRIYASTGSAPTTAAALASGAARNIV
ncbi:hypothetical protein [Roseisalinus antarcticus]|uniref:Uncharacterized protein n=1 Tax=Roseisalinus antarcticus TaxID=254357 RepID=A0A1Y5SXS4_9RHOB|nr:hypothetical protein [Roseisalinus antarcticus]SLN47551.1 hypothetical protein ROA7023_02008 [Roseisalinus antarcticus]